MNEQLTLKSELKNLNPEGVNTMLQALDSFFQAYPENVVCHMETILYDWYTHAQDHYLSGHIDEVVNRTFKVNDLLLKLYDGMLLLKDTDPSPVDELVDGSYKLRQVSKVIYFVFRLSPAFNRARTSSSGKEPSPFGPTLSKRFA